MEQLGLTFKIVGIGNLHSENIFSHTLTKRGVDAPEEALYGGAPSAILCKVSLATTRLSGEQTAP